MFCRRANLDAFWSREPGTVSGNKNRAQLDLAEVKRKLGLRGLLPKYGESALGDWQGMGPAVMTLMASLRPGRYRDNLQYYSTRKTQTAYNNLYEASGRAPVGAVLGRADRKMHPMEFPTARLWFARFSRGTKLMMED